MAQFGIWRGIEVTAAGELGGVDNPEAGTLAVVRFRIAEAAATDTVFDVLKNGASIYTDPDDRPTIAAGQTSVKQDDLAAVADADIEEDDEITFDAVTVPVGGVTLVDVRIGVQTAGGGGAPVFAAVTWQDITGADLNADNSLTKTASAGWGNAGAWGTEGFPVAQGMRIRFIGDTDMITGAISFGISVVDSDQSYASADFSFIPYPGGWTVYENGVEKYNVNANVAWATGDKFEIRVSVEGEVTYWFDDALVYTSLTTAVGTYHADVALSPNGTTVPPVQQRAEV